MHLPNLVSLATLVLAASLAAPAAAQTITYPTKGEWNGDVNKDGSGATYVNISPKSFTGREGNPAFPIMIISCERDSAKVRFIWWEPVAGGPLQSGGERYAEMRVRLDGGEPETVHWEINQDSMTVDRTATPFIYRLLDHDLLEVETTFEDGRPVAASYPLTSLRSEENAAISQEQCGW